MALCLRVQFFGSSLYIRSNNEANVNNSSGVRQCYTNSLEKSENKKLIKSVQWVVSTMEIKSRM